MSNDTLFPIAPKIKPNATSGDSEPRPAPRLRCANRQQLEMRPSDLDSLLPADHPARAIWAIVEQLDLSAFYDEIAARGSDPGRAATDPKILVALWLYAATQHVGYARELERLCEAHDAYRWLCGGISVNYHTLADFRVDPRVQTLVPQVLAVLMHQGIVSLDRLAQDGMRVRANAGASSFRRGATLEKCHKVARARWKALQWEDEDTVERRSERQRAAAERAARETEQRVQRALAELPKVEAAKTKPSRKREPRASTTDPDARFMKMADGGFRPAYNVQLATDTKSGTVVAFGVTNVGSDFGQVEPMLEEVAAQTGSQPKELLVDGGYARKESIEATAARGVTLYAPVSTPRVSGIDPHQPKEGDTPAVAAWRVRMGTGEAQAIYKERASTAERTNAELRCQRGLDRLVVRGRGKVLNVVAWSVLALNVLIGLRAGAWG